MVNEESVWLTHHELVVCVLRNFDFPLVLHLFKDVEITGVAARWSWDQVIIDTFGLSHPCC